MHVMTLIVWIVALIAFAVEAERSRPALALLPLGLFAFALAWGLQALIETADPIIWDL